jgi:hypothetical protein
MLRWRFLTAFRFGGIMRTRMLMEFLRSAMGFATIDADAIEEAGESASQYTTYHRRIVGVSAIFGCIGALSGIVFIVSEINTQHGQKDLPMLLFSPVLFGIIGLLLGAAIACLFAPEQFLTGPIGSKWMKLIGTESVLVARLTCFILGVMLPVFALALLIVFPLKG